MKGSAAERGVFSAVAGLLAVSCNVAFASDGTWVGTVSASWTNELNWSAAPYPSGDESALFSGAGNGRTNVSVEGLSAIAIKTLTFDSYNAAPYTLGAGAVNSQTLVLRNGGVVQMTGSADNGQRVNAAIQLGQDMGGNTYTIQCDHPNNTLTLAGNVTGASGGGTAGAKTLKIAGTGNVAILGNVTKGGATSLTVADSNNGTLVLSGTNTISQLSMDGAPSSVIDIGSGQLTFSAGGGVNLIASQDCTIKGTGSIVLSNSGGDFSDNSAASGKTLTLSVRLTGNKGFEYWHASNYGTIVLNATNDFTQDVIMNAPGTISCSRIGNKGSLTSNLGAGTTVTFATKNGPRLLYTGSGETTDRILAVQVDAILEQGGSGNLKFTTSPSVSGVGRTLTLQGSSSGTGEFGAPLGNGTNMLNLLKAGTGRWTLSAANTYTGSTTVAEGTLALSGANGAIASASCVLSAGGTLLLENSAAANNTNRVSNSGTLALNGGRLAFAHTGGTASYSETVWPVTIGSGANTITASQADAGQTSTLTLSGLTRTGGSVNFVGAGLGVDMRNRILIAGQTNGLIGAWATYNNSWPAAYDSALGVIPASDAIYTDISARGPSAITNNAASYVRINSAGTSGPITLSDSVTAVSALLQNTTTTAMVDTAAQTLRVSSVLLPDGKAALTIGAAANDGTLTAAAAGDVLTLANDATNATLTVNAAIANYSTATALVKLGAGTVALRGATSYTGTTAVSSGTLVLDSVSAQALAGAVSGAGSLVKEGTNRLTLAAANTYSGPTFINSGTVVALNSAAFGSVAAGTTITNGATLDVGGSAADTLYLPEAFTVSGAGVGAQGAIINSGNQQTHAFGKIALAGDATVGGSGRWDIRENTPALELNDYKLTKAGTNLIALVGAKVVPGTGSIEVVQGILQLGGNTTLNGNVTNTVTLRSGTALNYYGLAFSPVSTPWSLVLDDQTKVHAWQGALPMNNWAGPVSLNGLTLLDGGAGCSETFSGPLSGAGRIVKVGASVAYLTSSNNAYAGSTLISNGTLVAYYAGSLPNYASAGQVSVSGGATLMVRTGDGCNGWSPSQFDTLLNTATFAASTATLAVDTTPGNFTHASAITKPLSVSKQGNNTLTLAGANTYSGATTVGAGSLVFSGTNVLPGAMATANGGKLIFASASSNVIGGTVSMSGGSTLGVSGPTKIAYPGQLNVGNGSGDRSVVLLSGPPTFAPEDFVQLGCVSGAAGAFYQTGGTLATRVLSLGVAGGGYGYYRLTGGGVAMTGDSGSISTYLEIGTGGDGVMEIFGGTLAADNVFNFVSRQNGFGLLNVFGGLARATSGSEPIKMGRSDLSAPKAAMNIFGSGVVDAAGGSASKILDMNAGASAGGITAVGLITGGTLIANKVGATRSGALFFNFNGGTLKAAPGTTVGSTFLQGLFAATVYPGGAVIDTTNANVTINQPLLAPTGYGVSSLLLGSGGAGYVGAPILTLAGGSGTGALAIASVDLSDGSVTKGQVTGFTVTSPGFGYQSGDKLTVTLRGGGYTAAAVTGTCVLAANSASGGLTKLGSGRLTLGGTNTYGGVTTISDGTLRLGVANALPTNAAVNVVNGVYDLNGFAVTNGAVTGQAGTIRGGSQSNAMLVCSSFTKTGAGTLTLEVSSAPSAPLVVSEGTLRLFTVRPGLYEGPVTGEFDIVSDVMTTTNLLTQLTTRMANTTAGWPEYTTFIYRGYVWNQAATNVTWTFGENFDDSVLLKIDGTTLLNNRTWSEPTLASVTLAPGAHVFEARFGQGNGGVGPVNGSWWKTGAFGFGVDFLGRHETNIANYVALTDPGDGSLLSLAATWTNLLSTSTLVSVASNAVLDLGGGAQALAGLSGGGWVTNGTLSVNGTVAPGGTNVIGTLSVAAATTLGGALLADVSSGGACDKLVVQGNLNLADVSLEVANPSQLNRSKVYALVTCTGTLTGTFSSAVGLDSRWRLMYRSDGTVVLLFTDGMLIKVR